MDFSLFMERYGFKILLILMVLIALAPIFLWVSGLLYSGMKYGLTLKDWVLIGIFLLIMSAVAGKLLTAYGKAHAYYWLGRENTKNWKWKK